MLSLFHVNKRRVKQNFGYLSIIDFLRYYPHMTHNTSTYMTSVKISYNLPHKKDFFWKFSIWLHLSLKVVWNNIIVVTVLGDDNAFKLSDS